MYKKSVQGWLKHLDFMILDVVCLWISFTLAFNMRHGSLDVLANSLYRDMMWSLALMDIVVIFFFDSLKNVLKRGFYQEFVMTVKQTCLITLCSVFYLFTFKEAENYSRLVLGYTAALYLLLSYVLRCLWKNCLRKYFGGAEKRSLLIVTVSDIVDTVIDNIKNKNYGDYFVTGVCILDKKAKGRVIDGVTVVADEDDLVEYVCREWVDEVFINIPESEPYPAELLDKFIEMGVVVHMKLAKSQNLLGKKQFVEHLGTYTVLTTSINSVSRRQIILKRMMDIAGGLAGCIITGILCIFVGPAIYIQSPGPIFFKQTRVGKNGKMFQMYKFRSMYMDAEERKAELMKENRVQDGMMFKLDFDPRIIGSKKLPDGTIKKGVGNFIRDWSLDEFPQFLNVLKGDMSLVGTRPPTVDEWDKYELHHRARLATKPGLTGMWQVSGRSNITDFEEVVKLDKQYISEWTMGLDIKILRHYFYGSTEETLKLLEEKLQANYPGIQIAGMYSPPFRPLTEEEDKNIIENINKIKPDFVWIGLGAPKQEKWMAEHQGKIDAQYFCEFICNNISNFAIVKCFEIPVVNIFQTWYNVVISINGGR